MKRKHKCYIDVTKEYFEMATPNKGNIDKEDGYPNNSNEEDIARIIHRELGGDILLINENLTVRGHSPDYKWNEELWDLKSPESVKSFTKRMRKGIHQIESAPGGLIVRLPDNIQFTDLIDTAWRRWKTTAQKKTTSLDIIFIQNDKIAKIIRFNK